MQTTWVQYVIIALYFIFIVTKGMLRSRKISHQDDFLVAGRNIGWFFLMATMSATVLGGGSSIGAIGRTYEWGILMLLVSIGWYLQFIFSGFFIAPTFRELKLYTVAGFFGHRYDEKNRFLAFVLSLLFSVGVLGAQMVAFGKIITAMIPEIPYLWAVIMGGSIVILYSTAGGLLAVIHTDVYQFIILFFGFLLTMFLCIPDILASKTEIRNVVPPEFFQMDGGKGWFFALSTFLAFLLGETFAPGYVTRFVVGKDIRNTKWGIVGSGVFLTFTFPVILFFIALYAKLNFPDIDGEQALPMTINKLHNPIISGIIIAALMSAVMSSADSILNSSTAIFVKDLYEHYYLKKRSGKIESGLKIARYFSVFIGITGVLLALVLPNVIDLLLLTYTLWAPGIILPVIVGIFSKRKSPKLNLLMFFTIVISVTTTMIFKGLEGKLFEQPAVLGVIASVLIYGIGSFFITDDRKVLKD
jgi:SSS family solute:Na+ symporter